MPRYRVEDGITIQLTAEEETARDAEETQWLSEKPMNDWLEIMSKSDSELIPRWAEDIIALIGTEGLALETVQKYNDKQALRAQKP